MIIAKLCIICNITKPINDFQIKQGRCKSCQRAYIKAHRKRTNYAPTDITQTCIKCELSKPSSAFQRCPKNRTGLLHTCKTCFNSNRKKWRKYTHHQRITAGGKFCPSCRIYKPVDDFSTNYIQADGLSTKCRQCINNHIQYQRHNNPEIFIRSLVTSVKSRCKIAKRECTITKQSICELFNSQQGLCAITKLPLTLKPHQPSTLSIDRIDSNGGYTNNNVQLVCTSINIAKSNFTMSQFTEWLNVMAKSYLESLHNQV